jgi:hypothetical protein
VFGRSKALNEIMRLCVIRSSVRGSKKSIEVQLGNYRGIKFLNGVTITQLDNYQGASVPRGVKTVWDPHTSLSWCPYEVLMMMVLERESQNM